jgi:putative lipoprotein
MLVGCGGGTQSDGAVQEADAGPPIAEAVVEGAFRGMAIFDVDGQPRFEPCGPVAAASLLLVDSAGGDLEGAYQELVGEPGGRLYVEVRGRVEPVDRGMLPTGPDRRLVATNVRRAAFDADGCDEALDGLVFRALGNEPFWNVDVTTLDITLNRPESRSITFPFAAPQDSLGMTVYATRAPGGPDLRLVLTEERCHDSMSGFWFPFSVRAVVDADTLTGCAAQGW